MPMDLYHDLAIHECERESCATFVNDAHCAVAEPAVLPAAKC